MSMRRTLRATLTLLTLGLCLTAAGLHGIARLRPTSSALDRARWQQYWATRILRVLRVRTERQGEPPTTGMLVANHLGYLDIPVLAARQPLVFVAKAEVRRWPGLGALVALGGTRFIVRERRGDVARVARELAHMAAQGVLPTVFPEGTSTAGDTVRPFRPSLLEPAVRQAWPVTPVALAYTCRGGDVARDVAWWGDMSLLPHLWRLAGLESVTARVGYGIPIPPREDRKVLAGELHGAVLAHLDQAEHLHRR